MKFLTNQIKTITIILGQFLIILFQDFIIEDAELQMYQNLFLGRLKKFHEINNIS